MINLGPIDFLLGLLLNINVNNGQNKFEVHILKNMARIANFQPKLGQDATFAPTFNRGLILPFFIRFLHPTTPKLSARRDESNDVKKLSSITFL